MRSNAIPIDCPRCRKTLYPLTTLRPKPVDSLATRIGFLIGGVVSLCLALFGFYIVRVWLEINVPAKIMVVLLMVPAIVPGILIGIVFSRFPRVLTLRCSTCNWSETFRVARTMSRPVSARYKSGPTFAEVGSARSMPEPTPPPIAGNPPPSSEGPSPFDQIVDDAQPKAELRAWIYAEFVSGRTAEEITEELCSRGWSIDQVEGFVEEGRTATRHRRP
jgi:hypothetical protein